MSTACSQSARFAHRSELGPGACDTCSGAEEPAVGGGVSAARCSAVPVSQTRGPRDQGPRLGPRVPGHCRRRDTHESPWESGPKATASPMVCTVPEDAGPTPRCHTQPHWVSPGCPRHGWPAALTSHGQEAPARGPCCDGGGGQSPHGPMLCSLGWALPLPLAKASG